MKTFLARTPFRESHSVMVILTNTTQAALHGNCADAMSAQTIPEEGARQSLCHPLSGSREGLKRLRMSRTSLRDIRLYVIFVHSAYKVAAYVFWMFYVYVIMRLPV